MAPAASKKQQQQQQQDEPQWSTAFDTKRRQELFRNPPKDKTAYPTLAAAVDPHINSFNAIFAPGGQIEEAIKDIGTKVFADGDPYALPEEVGPRNTLSVRIQDVFLDKAVLPPSNKVALKNRNIMPAETRERHATYRGKLRARLEYRVNNEDWREEVCDLGNVPIMLRVRTSQTPGTRTAANALVIVQPVSPREHEPRPARQGQGRERGAWRLLRRQWH
jgi:DNA-directed RNA polymerase I subunit RPA2